MVKLGDRMRRAFSEKLLGARAWTRAGLLLGAFASFLVSSAAAAAPIGETRPWWEEPQGPSPETSSEPQASAPRLLVFLVVDQLRGDLLDRYASLFTGGFRRLLDEGLVYTRALHDHATTETAPGHASLSTAVYPARAGVPANVWREGEEMRTVVNVVDAEVGLIGVPGAPGASPRVLRRTGLADWVLQANPEAKVLSVSAKDRAAVLMAGKSKGGVYWFDSPTGRFVTSTYYASENPPWLDAFNGEIMPEYRADSIWGSTIPSGEETLSAPDTAAFEGDGVHSYFPHRYGEERIAPETDDFFLWFETTPMLDRATLDLALAALREDDLGRVPGRTDFLSISFSQTDRVGHAFGPLSREQLDNLLRLDRDLDRLFRFLDETVSPDQYVVGLSADHGVMTMPERLNDGGRRLSQEDRTVLQEALSEAARESTRSGAASPAAFMVDTIRGLPFVGPAYTRDELLQGEPSDSFAALFQHSLVPDRPTGLLGVYGVEMAWAEFVLDWSYSRVGTTHGSPYFYDRWVPLILMGPGIEAGRNETPVVPLDLGPTLAGIAGIPTPDDLDGRPLPRGSDQDSQLLSEAMTRSTGAWMELSPTITASGLPQPLSDESSFLVGPSTRAR